MAVEAIGPKTARGNTLQNYHWNPNILETKTGLDDAFPYQLSILQPLIFRGVYVYPRNLTAGASKMMIGRLLSS